MTSSVSKVEKSMRFFRDKDTFSPPVRRQNYFREDVYESQSSSEIQESSEDSRGTDPHDSIYGIDHKKFMRKGSSKRDLKLLIKSKSRMFVKGTNNIFKSEDELLNSEKDIHRSESDPADDAQTIPLDRSIVLSLQKVPSIRTNMNAPTEILIKSSRGKAEKIQTTANFALSRNSIFISIWNFIILASILLDLVLIPLEVSLQDIEYVGPISFALINLVQIIYIIDIWVNFSKTYHDKQVREVTDLHSIRTKYFESYDFCIDLFACAPMLAFFKIFYYTKGYNQMFLLVRIVKAFKLKSIIVEFHQRFYVSSKLYFLGYLISVLIIVNSANVASPGKLYMVCHHHTQIYGIQTSGQSRRVSDPVFRFKPRRRRDHRQGVDVAASHLSKHRARGFATSILRGTDLAQIFFYFLQLCLNIIRQRDSSDHDAGGML